MKAESLTPPISDLERSLEAWTLPFRNSSFCFSRCHEFVLCVKLVCWPVWARGLLT